MMLHRGSCVNMNLLAHVPDSTQMANGASSKSKQVTPKPPAAEIRTRTTHQHAGPAPAVWLVKTKTIVRTQGLRTLLGMPCCDREAPPSRWHRHFYLQVTVPSGRQCLRKGFHPREAWVGEIIQLPLLFPSREPIKLGNKRWTDQPGCH